MYFGGISPKKSRAVWVCSIVTPSKCPFKKKISPCVLRPRGVFGPRNKSDLPFIGGHKKAWTTLGWSQKHAFWPHPFSGKMDMQFIPSELQTIINLPFLPTFPPWFFLPKIPLVAKMQANLRDLARQSVQDVTDGFGRIPVAGKKRNAPRKRGANFKTERIGNSNRTGFFVEKTHGGFPRV